MRQKMNFNEDWYFHKGDIQSPYVYEFENGAYATGSCVQKPLK